MVTAHPRSRGENWDARGHRAALIGSSPLTRGKRDLARRPAQGRRLIPAHAGKTLWWVSRPYILTAHPRSRGENDEAGKPVAADDGSSPLTRGKRRYERRCQGDHRLIPAHAGKTVHMILGALEDTAHPRSRGENTR